jgi:hypothetical protein
MHWFIAVMAVETGIAPDVLLRQDVRMLWTMGKVLEARNSQ